MVDIVIVNWNSGNYLKKCIDSIFVSGNENIINQVIVVDNNSADSSLQFILPNQKIKLVVNKDNLGFAAACNQGFKLCTAEYILLLNPDTILFNNTIKSCASFMDATGEVDVLGCQLLDDDNKIAPSCSRFPSPMRIFFDASGLSKMAPNFFKPSTIMLDWDHEQSRYVDQVMGAFMFMRKKLFEKIRYFDERFFVYYEEVDFCKRLAGIHGKVFYTTAIQAIHSGEGTTQAVKAFRLYLNLKSRLLYAKKHFSPPGYIFVWMCTYFIEPFARILFLWSKGEPAEAAQVWKGFMMLVRNNR